MAMTHLNTIHMFSQKVIPSDEALKPAVPQMATQGTFLK